ncbi:MAG: DUF1467 family protein [Alphaproteobacteria bacterium]|jgi:predicted secreted protein|nr:DUF1467 family protein [Alphaproteobacteria bacterium]MDP6814284.1 DUF1467 family protein [Alphaproteobacteria bacterium]|tara:strand:- start:153 stop:413 length:261 start_codon:yes stop_codon:yes gene_type:complete
MSLATGILVFAITWWLVLLMVLPFGVRTTGEAGGEAVDGQAASAPTKPRILLKMAITTGIAGLIVGVAVFVLEQGWVDPGAYFRQN